MKLFPATLVIVLSVLLVTASCSKKGQSTTVYREGESPVTSVPAEDPEMIAAIQKGKDTLAEFIAEITKHPPYPGLGDKPVDVDKMPVPKTAYSIKVPYPTPDNSVEHIWVDVAFFKGRVFHGVIDNEPLNLPSYKLGQRVEVKQEEVEDWIILDEKGAMRGGFTAKLLMERETGKSY